MTRSMNRKGALATGFALGSAVFGITGASAADYPNRPITMLIPAAPGGAFDIDARLLIPAMEKALGGATIVPQNFPGGPIAPTQLYKAKPDGYTISIFQMPGALLLQLMGKAEFQVENISWFGRVAHEVYALAVAADSPINSIADLKKLAHPVKFTSVGPGSTAYAATRLAMHTLALKGSSIITGYQGAPEYITAVVRGDGDATITNLTALKPYVQSRQVKLLLAFDDANVMPGVPNARSIGAPILARISLDTLLGAPPGLPADIRKRLSDATLQAIRDPETQSRAKEANVNLVPGDARQAAATVASVRDFFTKNPQFIGAP
jgi:tripartite-type tricarboxylate transporter receptor subunit TctC